MTKIAIADPKVVQPSYAKLSQECDVIIKRGYLTERGGFFVSL